MLVDCYLSVAYYYLLTNPHQRIVPNECMQWLLMAHQSNADRLQLADQLFTQLNQYLWRRVDTVGFCKVLLLL
jgi:hypothetical protein